MARLDIVTGAIKVDVFMAYLIASVLVVPVIIQVSKPVAITVMYAFHSTGEFKQSRSNMSQFIFSPNVVFPFSVISCIVRLTQTTRLW